MKHKLLWLYSQQPNIVLPDISAKLEAAPSGRRGRWSHHHNCLRIFGGWVWKTLNVSYRKQTYPTIWIFYHHNVAYCTRLRYHCQMLFTATQFHPNATNYQRVGWLFKMLIAPINLVPAWYSLGEPIILLLFWPKHLFSPLSPEPWLLGNHDQRKKKKKVLTYSGIYIL